MRVLILFVSFAVCSANLNLDGIWSQWKAANGKQYSDNEELIRLIYFKININCGFVIVLFRKISFEKELI